MGAEDETKKNDSCVEGERETWGVSTVELRFRWGKKIRLEIKSKNAKGESQNRLPIVKPKKLRIAERHGHENNYQYCVRYRYYD